MARKKIVLRPTGGHRADYEEEQPPALGWRLQARDDKSHCRRDAGLRSDGCPLPLRYPFLEAAPRPLRPTRVTWVRRPFVVNPVRAHETFLAGRASILMCQRT